MNTMFDWRDMLRFDKMIAPVFLTILYYIQVVMSMLTSLWFIMQGMDAHYGGGIMVMGGLAGLFIGPFVIRLFYEILIVIFKIHTRLSNIDSTLRGQPLGASPPEPPRQNTPRANPPASPIPTTFPPNYFPSEHTGFVQPQRNPVPNSVVPLPIGFHVPATEPTPSEIPVDPPIPDFFTVNDASPLLSDSSPTSTPVPPLGLVTILEKVPNWPASLAGLLVLYAVVSPYATIQPDLPIIGNLLGTIVGNTYSLKNSQLGMVVVLGTIAMVGISAGGFQWLWFVFSYGFTLLGSVMAFLSNSSLFSQIANVKSGVSQAGSTLGQFIPEADRMTNKLIEQAPSASQFLNMSFYVFFISMMFLGYWALAGKYQERGLVIAK